MISNQQVRRLALALLLSAGCGDDGDDGDDDNQMDDGGTLEAGAGDGGALDDGSIDAGSDASTLIDANLGDGDVGDASAVPDASAEEIQAALVQEGVRYDQRRADLTINAFCSTGVRCNFNGNPNLTEEICLSMLYGVWNESLRAGDPPECLDALLDFNSCGATQPCNTEGCGAVTSEVGRLCPE